LALVPRSVAAAGATAQRTPLSEALALGPEAWDPLLAVSPAASPFSGWAWHRAWADSAAPEVVAASEALQLRDSDGALSAILPFALRRTRWRRVPVDALTWASGDAGCPDHLDMLAAPGADLHALAAALEALPWQIVLLENVADPAPNLDRLCVALAQGGHAVRPAPLWACPRLALPDSWDAYLATLSSARRQTVRRKERALSRDHAVTLTDYAAGRVEEGWAHLLRLHDQRWSGQGAFRDPAIERLQLSFAREMAQRQRLWLTTLDLDEEPAAAWYGFSSEDTVYFYQSGRAPRWEGESVGLVLMGMMIRRAIERGYKWFDFLRGEDAYKRDWTSTQRMTREVVVFRAGWRGGWVRALDWVAGRRRHA
jgi:CelD/BcsL family acetyltransferase involved in cellulose biosynthesis